MANPKPILLTKSSQSAPSPLTETAETPLRLVDSSQPVAKANVEIGNKQLLLAGSMVANHGPLSLTESSHSTLNRCLEGHQKPSLPIDFSHSPSQNRSLELSSLDARRSSQMFSKQSVATMYNGIFGTVTILKKSKHAGSSLGPRTEDAGSMSRETVVFFRPSFWKKYYELRCKESFSGISRTLNVDRVVGNGDPVFQLCRSGDIIGLHGAFRGGRASPDMVNECGMGLLHVSDLPAILFTLRMLMGISMPQVIAN